jgi:hypothetical protein
MRQARKERQGILRWKRENRKMIDLEALAELTEHRSGWNARAAREAKDGR